MGTDAQTSVVLFYDINEYFECLFALICIGSLFYIVQGVSLCVLGENKGQEDAGQIRHLQFGLKWLKPGFSQLVDELEPRMSLSQSRLRLGLPSSSDFKPSHGITTRTTGRH